MAIERSEIVRIARTWVGTNYHHQASQRRAGCDCLGLVRGVWREVTGQEHEPLPPYTPLWAEEVGEETLYLAAQRYFIEIDVRHALRGRGIEATQPGDVALFRMRESGPAKHCGFVAAAAEGTRTMIHAYSGYAVREEPLTGAWAARLAYAFRFPELT